MTVIDYLYRCVEESPEKKAVTDAEKSLTFRELSERAERIGSFLAQHIQTEKDPVLVLCGRNAESVCCFLGVAMSRNFYVPVDADQPAGRLEAILEQMQPVAVVDASGRKELPEGLSRIPVFHYQELLAEQPDEERLADLRRRSMDTDPLFAICTSGSTGVPKGVVKSHRSVLSFIPVFCETFGFCREDVFGNQAPFDFDVSAKDIYSALYLGATFCIIPRVCFTMPARLVPCLNENKVTVIVWAVSALCVAAAVNVFRKETPRYIRRVLFSGEIMPPKMLNIWRNYCPQVMFVNLYGPTESTGNCLYYIVNRDFAPEEQLPLGRPFPNQEVLFLNDENKPAGPGEMGEICILGSCLALGYYNNPEKTAASFVDNPLNGRYPERMYRTGDLAVLKEDGEYYFAARKDFQIKHMGHRIELEEIELHLNAVPGVTRASCLFDKEKNKIVACYEGEATAEEIILHLRKDLPKYMLPNLCYRLERLPLTLNGKIDRRGLRARYEGGLQLH